MNKGVYGIVCLSLIVCFSSPKAVLGAYGDYSSSRPSWLAQSITSSNGDFKVWFVDSQYHFSSYAGGADNDGDGLPDQWEIDYLGGTNAASAGDNDGDGFSNGDEYNAGSWPNNDYFRPRDTIDPAVGANGNNLIVQDVIDTLVFCQSKYSEWGFHAPYIDGDVLEVFIRYTPYGGWGNVDPIWCSPNHVENLADWRRKEVSIHELFHNVQHSYPDTPHDSDWFVEGSARMSQDFFYDGTDRLGNSMYCGEIEGFLGDPDSSSLFDRSYSAVYFWKYLCEQTGYQIYGQPYADFDAMDRFMEASEDEEGSDSIKEYLNGLPSSQYWSHADVDRFFGNWVTAQYTRRFNPPSMSDRYYYADEQENLPTTLLRPVAFENVAYNAATDSYTPETIPLNTGYLSYNNTNTNDWSVSLDKWRGRYYVFRPQAGARFVIFWIDGKPGKEMYTSYATVQGTDVRDIHYQFGEDLMRTIYNDNLDEIGIAVGALDEKAEYDLMCWSLSEFWLNILYPLTSNVAEIRAKTNTNDVSMVDVHVEVLVKQGETPVSDPYVRGLAPQLFEVYIDGQPATVVGGHEVGNQYWLACAAPDLSPGTYDLEVRLITETDKETSSVRYLEKPYLDRMIVIDRSGSMGSEIMGNNEKMMAAKAGARLYTDLTVTDDMLGLVSFGGSDDGTENDSTIHEPLKHVTDSYKDDVKYAIDHDIDDDPSKYELTAMGQGLRDGYDQLMGRGDSQHEWRVALLSDGLECVPPYWADPGISNAIVASPIKVDSIALGQGAHGARLKTIADTTGGNYFFVNVPTSPSPAAPAPKAASVQPRIQTMMADAYRKMYENDRDVERLWSAEGELTSEETFNVSAYKGMRDLVLTVNWARGYEIVPTLNAGGIAPDAESQTHAVYHLKDENTNWELNLKPNGSMPAPYLAVLSGKGKMSGELFFTHPDGSEMVGSVAKICLRLQKETHAFTGATAVATIVGPEGDAAEVSLFDTGQHGDMVPDDGIYSRDYRWTPWEGTYQVNTEATGAEEEVGRFRLLHSGTFLRYRKTYINFDVQKGEEDQGYYEIIYQDDQDSDGLVDSWENRYGLNPLDPNDAIKDFDEDGLTSLEEFWSGGDPNDPDTDQGGTLDGSEVSFRLEVFDFEDDPIEPATAFSANRQPVNAINSDLVLPGSGSNVLYWSRMNNYSEINIYRATSPGGPFTTIASGIPADQRPYVDSGLVNWNTYYYRMDALTVDGIRTRLSDTIAAIPKLDNVYPFGGMRISSAGGVVSKKDVELSLWSDDAQWMQLSDTSDFTGLSWIPYSTNTTYTIAGYPGINFVFVRFMDPSGNISLIFNDSVEYDGDGDGDGMGDGWEMEFFGTTGRTGFDDYDSDGLSDLDEFNLGTAPDTKDSDSDGMWDRWDTDHGYNPAVPDGYGDLDGDGYNDRSEFVAGTSEYDPEDLFALKPEAGQWSWPTVLGRLYTVYSSTNLLEGWTAVSNFTGIAGTGADMVFTDALEESREYHKVEVEIAP